MGVFERLAEAVEVLLLLSEVVVLEVEPSRKLKAEPWGRMAGKSLWNDGGRGAGLSMTRSE